MLDFIGGFNLIFEWFGQHISTMLLIGGFFAGFYFVYWFFKGAPDETEGTPTLLKVMTYLGVVVGIFLIGGGVNAWSLRGQESIYQYEVFTCVLAIIVGVALILRPIKDVPWAAIVGVIVAGFVVFVSATYLQVVTEGFASILGIDPYWVLLIVFALIFILIYMAFKLVEAIGRLLGKLLSSRPSSAIIMVLCAVEAILAYNGTSLWTVFGG